MEDWLQTQLIQEQIMQSGLVSVFMSSLPLSVHFLHSCRDFLYLWSMFTNGDLAILPTNVSLLLQLCSYVLDEGLKMVRPSLNQLWCNLIGSASCISSCQRHGGPILTSSTYPQNRGVPLPEKVKEAEQAITKNALYPPDAENVMDLNKVTQITSIEAKLIKLSI